MLKTIRFETAPIDISPRKSFFPNAKYQNKLYSICHTYILSKHNLIDFDEDIFIKEMNEPTLIRNLGLKNFHQSLEGKKKIETEYIKPSGEITGKKVKPQYIKVSKKYVLIKSKEENQNKHLKVIEYKRIQAFKEEKRVKIYDIQIDDSNLKFYEIQE